MSHQERERKRQRWGETRGESHWGETHTHTHTQIHTDTHTHTIKVLPTKRKKTTSVILNQPLATSTCHTHNTLSYRITLRFGDTPTYTNTMSHLA